MRNQLTNQSPPRTRVPRPTVRMVAIRVRSHLGPSKGRRDRCEPHSRPRTGSILEGSLWWRVMVPSEVRVLVCPRVTVPSPPLIIT